MKIEISFEEALLAARRWVGSVAGVQFVAEGVDDGEPCITVFVSSKHAADQLPAALGRFRVVIQGGT